MRGCERRAGGPDTGPCFSALLCLLLGEGGCLALAVSQHGIVQAHVRPHPALRRLGWARAGMSPHLRHNRSPQGTMHCAVHQQVTVLVHDLNLTNVVRVWQILWDNPDEPSALFTLGCHYLKDGQTTYALEHLRCRDHARLQSLAVCTACVHPTPTSPLPPHSYRLHACVVACSSHPYRCGCLTSCGRHCASSSRTACRFSRPMPAYPTPPREPSQESPKPHA